MISDHRVIVAELCEMGNLPKRRSPDDVAHLINFPVSSGGFGHSRRWTPAQRSFPLRRQLSSRGVWSACATSRRAGGPPLSGALSLSSAVLSFVQSSGPP